MIDTNLLLEKGATYRYTEAGEVIFNEGAPAAFYYQLVSGRVRWSHFEDNGKEVLHKIVEDGEAFGEFPLFDGEPYAASAIADSPCTILRLSAASFHELLAERPDIHLAFSKSLVSHLRFKFFLLNALSKNNPQTVLVELIDYFNQHGKLICKDCNRLMVTRQQLANMAGLRVETVIRAIKQLQQEDKLCIVKGKVFIPADGI
ncbi:Crp/Fnr family transcriptional regulator [Parapedobacter soli]|uniref:Crp/Fnr family transcriptional regulator n=1 Tax=Parapedobacter soli TaxID=416955 RepID=UPI0021C8E0C4|nr:Crp/Fnr family transcriptional regulator [Parapedobacter soli]